MASGWNLWVWLECIGVVSGCCCKEVYTVCAKKTLPLPFNETKRNGPFNETERAVHDPFFIRSRSVRIFRLF